MTPIAEKLTKFVKVAFALAEPVRRLSGPATNYARKMMIVWIQLAPYRRLNSMHQRSVVWTGKRWKDLHMTGLIADPPHLYVVVCRMTPIAEKLTKFVKVAFALAEPVRRLSGPATNYARKMMIAWIQLAPYRRLNSMHQRYVVWTGKRWKDLHMTGLIADPPHLYVVVCRMAPIAENLMKLAQVGYVLVKPVPASRSFSRGESRVMWTS
jgi:hypothetical protein